MMQAISKAGNTEPQPSATLFAATDDKFVCGPVKFEADHTSAWNGRAAMAGCHGGADRLPTTAPACSSRCRDGCPT